MNKKKELNAIVSARLLELAEGFDSFSEFARHIGYGRGLLMRWIDGCQLPSLFSAYEICEKTGCSLEWLCGKTEVDAFELKRACKDISDRLEKLEKGLEK